MSRSTIIVAAAVGLPAAGFVLLLTGPQLDLAWEGHRAHFWLVLAAGCTTAVLAYATGEAAERRGDLRLGLVSLTFLCCAGFLGLHALATPGVLLDDSSLGFVIAVPAGLVLASAIAALSASDRLSARYRTLAAHRRIGAGLLLAAMAAWAAATLIGVGPLDEPTDLERTSGGLVIPALAATALYLVAAARYARLGAGAPPGLPLAVAVAFILLGEATLQTALSRNWHTSWWEWHALMLTAFGLVAVTARREWREERFSALYTEETAQGKREVSIVFADLAGFTAFSEGRDPTEVSEMLNAYFERAIPPVVREHGGDVERLMGDALMVTFNARGDQPDHAIRAAAAALEIRDTTSAVAVENPGWPRFRVGVNTGEALVGILGATGGRSYTVIGDAVNSASRLESAAPVGEVAIGAATLRALPGVTARSLGSIEVKGRREPLDAYVLEALSSG
ncbi:MAG TPA: adenylate/guanylate cyclase domain-containing protein [Solirubrobacterales bacterium]|nr:adenylate/guanylate cyclase domain-containing protein [Solirubrobacterales bacterium]